MAATIAGVLSLEDAARLVHARALGTAVCARGGMLGLATGEDAALGLVADVPGLALAACNSERDAVVSGPPEAIDEAERQARQMNISTRRLAVFNGYHSPLMAPAADALEDACAGIDMQSPRFPLLSNLSGSRWGERETGCRYHLRREKKAKGIFYASNKSIQSRIIIKPEIIENL